MLWRQVYETILWVEILSPDKDDIENFEITNPTGKVFQFPECEQGLFYFKLAGVQEPRIWSYKVKLFHKMQYSRISVQSLAKPSHKEWAKFETLLLLSSVCLSINSLQSVHPRTGDPGLAADDA